MLKVVFVKIRKDKVETLRAWMKELSRRRTEVLETFAQEGVRHESVYLLDGAEGPVMAYAMEMESVARATAAYAASAHPLDEEHRRVLAEVIDGKAPAELLFECMGDA